MYGGSDRPEEEREDVTGLVWGNNDGCAEVLHLKRDQEKALRCLTLCTPPPIPSVILNLKHGRGLFRQGHVMYPDGKTEGISKENRPVHRVNRTIPNVEQRSCVVKAQVAEKRGNKEKLVFEIIIIFPHSPCQYICSLTHPSKTSAWYGISSLE